MKREALTDKILVLGIDGFEPRLAKKYLDEGKMPNLKKFQEMGASREDLVLLGAVPTVTPPLWTTLATGAYPGTHGITCFFGQDPENLDNIVYNLDSRRCKAEPLWNVFAEEGKQTLVWHWPGSSWPPTSDSENLMVVDGTQPITVGAGNMAVDILKIISAGEEFTETKFFPNQAELAEGTGCIINNVDDLSEDGGNVEENEVKAAIRTGKPIHNIMTDSSECEVNTIGILVADTNKCQITPATGWTNAPEGAKEFHFYVHNGLMRKYVLVTKNAEGIYDTVSVYNSKKDSEPIVTLVGKEAKYGVLDTIKNDQGETVVVTRNYQVLDIEPDGSKVNMIADNAIDQNNDAQWHPKSLLAEIKENVGPVPTRSGFSGVNPEVVERCVLPSWDNYCQWQADVLRYFMDNGRADVIFSHLHNVDSCGHLFWHYAKHQDEWGNDEKRYQAAIQEVYAQTDRYIGRFLDAIENDGWTVLIVSDHGLICSEHHGLVLAEMTGVNVPVMQELGYTVLKKDENGNDIKEIDWSKTKAVQVRGDHIYINLKGRDKYGIVDPADKYDVEEQLISDLYSYRDHETGKRVVSLAMRNRDAVMLGMNGPECGDIIFFKEEGFNIIHADSLSTYQGYADTSVSPIFLAAGPGIKKGCITDRVIRQVDVAPTVAFLGGVRLPDQNEGSVVHQILSEEI